MTSPGREPPSHPDSVSAGVRQLSFICPICRGRLGTEGQMYLCPGCDMSYPVAEGIPDFRVYPDRFLDLEADAERTQRVLEAFDRTDLPAMLEYYWRLSDFTPEALWRRYIATELNRENLAQRALKRLPDAARASGARLLDLGCGTGGMLSAATQMDLRAIGVDIAMRWLHVARLRFRDAGLSEPTLVCCCADYLPFADADFDIVTCLATLEFVPDPERLVGELARVLHRSGRVFLETPNRYSLLQDPYAALWGVGWLPRGLQAAYVRYRRDAHYDHVRLLSLRELRGIVSRHFRRVNVDLPTLEGRLLDTGPARYKRLSPFYRLARNLRPLKPPLRTVVPSWEVRLGDPIRCEDSCETKSSE